MNMRNIDIINDEKTVKKKHANRFRYNHESVLAMSTNSMNEEFIFCQTSN